MTKTVRLILVIITLCVVPLGYSQTASTGALTGSAMDTSRAMVPGVEITLTNEATSEARSAVSNENGTYVFPQLAPGTYRLEAALPGFKTAGRSGIRISVTETTRLDLQLEVGSITETVTVEAAPAMVQQESSALGNVLSDTVIANLPLVTRNFTQILGLSPGITTDVTNAGELGRGSGGHASGRTSVNGAGSQDNNFQIDGIEANDFQGSQGNTSPGAAVPNPDALQEFKVQTAMADASFGRNAGANVNIITKSGTNEFHGTLFEFFRNEALNANDFFFNRSGREKPPVRQNQYGGTIGGPIVRDKLLFFGSYQGTKQLNGLGSGKINAKCSSTISSPPLTDNRSAAALGALFGGLAGQNGGVAVRADGSNINPAALRLLNLKKADGSYWLPTPQTIDPSLPFARRGFSTFSVPCTFDEDQYVASVDYLHTTNSKFGGRLFVARSNQSVSYNGTANVPGQALLLPVNFLVTSMSHSWVLGPHLFNEFRAGWLTTRQEGTSVDTFNWSDIGVNAPGIFDKYITLTITGSYAMSASDAGRPQQNQQLQDHLSYVYGSHTLRFGGGANQLFADTAYQAFSPTMTFQSFPDFLLGLDAASNGSQFSNIFTSSITPTIKRYKHRVKDGFAYVQDDWKFNQRLTLNLGLRYERLGQRSDGRHAATNFDPKLANPNPPAAGTWAGYIVGSDWATEVPAGVTKSENNLTILGLGQNVWEPRVGFAWQVLPSSNRLLLRGGYGVHYVHTTGVVYADVGGATFAAASSSGTTNAAATFQNPFPPIPASLLPLSDGSIWAAPKYSPTSQVTTSGNLAQDWRPGLVQQYSLNTQTQLNSNLMLEIGYVGSRMTHMSRGHGQNQALLASPSNPVRGITTNTVANVRDRVPYLGLQPTTVSITESTGSGWYNGLQTSLTKRMSNGLQLLVSHTFSRTMSTDAAGYFTSYRGTGAGGDNTLQKQGYGRVDIGRDHRLSVSYTYEVPGFGDRLGVLGKLMSGWTASGVTVYQTGSPLTILLTNGNNATGITADRAQLAPGCTTENLETAGKLRNRLNQYFNTACFTTPPVIGSDGRATAFGNSGVGILDGPSQFNTDMSIVKKFALRESLGMEFRSEFFNLFNTAQFSNPDTNFSSSTFGQISSTSVNPRFVQFALKLTF